MGPPLEQLTFRDVTEAYRREKRSNDITEIRRDFYRAVKGFLDALWKDNQEEMCDDPFSLKALSISDTMKKVRSKTTQIFEMRAEKILLMALRASSGAVVYLERLTSEEKVLYSDALEVLERERRKMLPAGEKSSRSIPSVQAPEVDVPPETLTVEVTTPVEPAPEETVDEVPEPPQPVDLPEVKKAEIGVTDEDSLDDQVLVRVLEDIPPFAGPERDYVLNREDVATLPSVIARALVSRGKAL